MKTKTERSGTEKAREMNSIAKTIFAPVYPMIAKQVIQRFGITTGTCIDLGSGPASLSIAMAKASELQLIALDVSDDMQEVAAKNISDASLTNRIRLMYGDVRAIPLPDDTADLIVSRGSMFFWDDIHTAFREIYRVLKPGGRTYVGGGFGNRKLRDEITVKMTKQNPDWKQMNKKNMSPENQKRFATMLKEIGVPDYEILSGEEGFWIVLKKEHAGSLA